MLVTSQQKLPSPAGWKLNNPKVIITGGDVLMTTLLTVLVIIKIFLQLIFKKY